MGVAISQETTAPAVIVNSGRLEGFLGSVMQGVGFGTEDAALAAKILVKADLRGAHTHGVRYMPTYLPLIRGGAIRADAKPAVVRGTTAAALVDGDAGLGHLVAHWATNHAIEMVRDSGAGMATVLVRNSNHFGAAGYFPLMCAEEGYAAIVLTNSVPVMAAPGASGKVISNSPFAYGFPTTDGLGPIVLDICLSQSAGSRVLMAADRGEEIPEGWLLDEQGQPTTDPNWFKKDGALVGIGGHKGYALGLMVEILSGVMSGAGMLHEVLMYRDFPEDPSQTGHTIIVFDIEAFMDRAEYDVRIAELRRRIHEMPKAVGENRILLPGELEFAHEQDSLRNGLELDGTTWQELTNMSEPLGMVDELEATRW